MAKAGMRGSYGAHIQDEAAYQAAIERRIVANARKGRESRWFAADVSRRDLIHAVEVAAFDDQGGVRNVFMAKMHEAFNEWGSLTEGQENAIRKSFAEVESRKAAARARDAGSEWVGTIGQRTDWTLTVRAVTSYESNYGPVFVTIMADAAGNVVVAKGIRIEHNAEPVKRGDVVTLKATIKAHGERNGIKQTMINRPKVLGVVANAQ